ncbi:MAG: hypothetical protein DRO12_01410 [Thermoprotei archaeon]|nr:MAG: hypothetical protein DRO12_01410 [Thermoprotei archaeon]
MVTRFMLLFALVSAVFIGYACIGVFPGTKFVGASPLNPGWDGTFFTYTFLAYRGVDVVMAHSREDLNSLCGKGRIMLMLISPERALRREDVEAVKKLRDCVSELQLVIADESGVVNLLLENLGIPIRIVHEIIRGDDGSPYPLAKIAIPGQNPRLLVLDYAAPLQVWNNAKVIGLAAGKAVVALYEASGIKALIFGDGSIFLNHLVTLAGYNPYKELLLGVVEFMEPDVVVVDGYHYNLSAINLFNLMEHNPLTAVAALLNPLYWLLHMENGIMRLTRGFQIIMSNGIAGLIMVSLLTPIAMHWLTKLYGEIRECVRDRGTIRKELRYTVITHLRSIAEVKGPKYEDAIEALNYLRAVLETVTGQEVKDLRSALLTFFRDDPIMFKKIEEFFRGKHSARTVVEFVGEVLERLGEEKVLNEGVLKLWVLGRGS